jgi:uncharacterized protein YecA (UPF0149 family)
MKATFIHIPNEVLNAAESPDIEITAIACESCISRPAMQVVNGKQLCNPCAGGQSIPYRRNGVRIGRNERCFCGSGRKFKHCHMRAT